MKTKEYKIGTFNHLGSDYYDKLQELTNVCESRECFIFEKRIFAGNKTNTIKQYLLENPSKPFFIWLIDNKLELNQDN